jgi:hypothetical protein
MNFSLPNIILGFISIGIGAWMIKDAFHINHHILFLGWVEKKYGPGTGTNAYQIFGLGMCVFGIFVCLGYIDLFSNAFGSSTPVKPNTNITTTGSGQPGGSRIAD